MVTFTKIIIRYSNIELGYKLNREFNRFDPKQLIYLNYLRGYYNNFNLNEIILKNGNIGLPINMIEIIFNKIILDYNFNIYIDTIKTDSIIIKENGDQQQDPIPIYEKSKYITFQDSLYCSPEKFKGLDCFLPSQSEKSNIWSFGITLYHCLTGTIPFQTFPSIVEFINSNQQYVSIPPIYYTTENYQLISLITRMLCKNPKHRIGWDEIIDHRFFK